MKKKIWRLFIHGIGTGLPLIIFALLVYWLVMLINSQVAVHLTPFLAEFIPLLYEGSFHTNILAWFASLAIIFVGFVALGIIISTSAGKFLLGIPEMIFDQLPVFKFIKNGVRAVFKEGKSPIQGVVRLYPYGKHINIWQYGYVTKKRSDGTWAIFVPYSPNPTTGPTYFTGVPQDLCEITDETVEETFSTIITCGAGLAELKEVMKEDDDDAKNTP